MTMATKAQKVRRIRHTDPGAPRVHWLNAREVPVEVLQREHTGQPVDGIIVCGPGGQTTFVGTIRDRSA